MNLTEEGLRQIEHYADKKKDVSIMFLVQILRELREFRESFEQAKDSGYRCNNPTNSTDKGEY